MTPLASAAFLFALFAGQFPEVPDEPAKPPAKKPVTDRGNLGIQLQAMHPGQNPEGARIVFIFPESAAAEMGLHAGDEVLTINGIDVPDQRFLSTELRNENIGAKIKIGIRRDGKAMELTGRMGSYQKTRKAFQDHMRRELVGKPFEPHAEIVWPAGVDGIKASRGKVTLVVAFDDCQNCIERKWKKFASMEATLSQTGNALDWLGFAGIYSSGEMQFAANEESLMKVLGRHPAAFPVGIARYAGERIPENSHLRDAIIQTHGVCILDPEGKVFYIEADPEGPGVEFLTAIREAQEKFGKKPEAAPKDPAPPK